MSADIRERTGAKVCAVDVSASAIKMAGDMGLEAFRADVSCDRLPWQDDYFDVVHFGQIIEHLVDPDFALSEVRRVTTRGGVVVLSTPNLAAWSNRLLLLVGVQPLFTEVSTKSVYGRPSLGPPVGHLRVFTLRALQDFLKANGFSIEKVLGATFPSISHPLLHVLDALFSGIPSYSSVVVVAARKI